MSDSTAVDVVVEGLAARLSKPGRDGTTRAVGRPPRPVPAADQRLRPALARRPTRVARRRATRARSTLAGSNPAAEPLALAEVQPVVVQAAHPALLPSMDKHASRFTGTRRPRWTN